MLVYVVLGTRPEAIKLAPVVRAFRNRGNVDCKLVSTGQHRQMVDQALEAFDLSVDVQFDSMSHASSLAKLSSRIFSDLDDLFHSTPPDWILVQGDTTTAMIGAMTAFYRRIAIGHVEAGLRTYNRWSPFPEEVNRSIISRVADIHFAPTSRSAENLYKEGISKEAVHVTGNTVVDALLNVAKKVARNSPAEIDRSIPDWIGDRRLVLVTSHRRESFGEGLESICKALLEIIQKYPDVVIIYPVHLNPNVKEPVYRLLGGQPRIRLLPPVGYESLVYLMQKCHCIFTDSGGIQEEAPSLGKPILIMRDTTERPEVVDAGCARIVGTSTTGILQGAAEVLENERTYESMSHRRNPFGDGLASERIVDLTLGTKFI